jgi:hypothetical protein
MLVLLGEFAGLIGISEIGLNGYDLRRLRRCCCPLGTCMTIVHMLLPISWIITVLLFLPAFTVTFFRWFFSLTGLSCFWELEHEIPWGVIMSFVPWLAIGFVSVIVWCFGWLFGLLEPRLPPPQKDITSAWIRVAPLIAGLRANEGSPLSDSMIQLLPDIARFVGPTLNGIAGGIDDIKQTERNNTRKVADGRADGSNVAGVDDNDNKETYVELPRIDTMGSNKEKTTDDAVHIHLDTTTMVTASPVDHPSLPSSHNSNTTSLSSHTGATTVVSHDGSMNVDVSSPLSSPLSSPSSVSLARPLLSPVTVTLPHTPTSTSNASPSLPSPSSVSSPISTVQNNNNDGNAAAAIRRGHRVTVAAQYASELKQLLSSTIMGSLISGVVNGDNNNDPSPIIPVPPIPYRIRCCRRFNCMSTHLPCIDWYQAKIGSTLHRYNERSHWIEDGLRINHDDDTFECSGAIRYYQH